MNNINETHTQQSHWKQNVGRPKLYYTEDEIATAKRGYSNRWYQQNKEKKIARVVLYQQQNRDRVNLCRRMRYLNNKTTQNQEEVS
jgi:hypothetical protein